MSSGLILMGDKNLSNLVALNLEIYLDLKCATCNSLEEFGNFSPILSHFQIIILDPKINNQDAIEVVKSSYDEQELDCPLLVFAKAAPMLDYSKPFIHYLDTVSIPKVLKISAKLLDITAEDMASRIVPNKIALDIRFIEGMNSLPCAVYKRHILDNKEKVYQIAFDKGEDVSKYAYDKMVEQKIKKVFVTSGQRLSFVNAYTSYVLSGLKKANGGNQVKYRFLNMTRDFICSNLLTGEDFTDAADLADQSIKETIDIIEKCKDQELKKFLKNLKASTDSYFLQSAQLISYIGFKILQGLGWTKMSQKATIASASFLHNILFEFDQIELAKIRSEEEFNDMVAEKKATAENEKLVLEHARDTAIFVSNLKSNNFQETTITVLREQHGNRRGVGFSRDNDSGLHTLSIIFILARDYADCLLLDNMVDPEEIMAKLRECYYNSKKFTSFLQYL